MLSKNERSDVYTEIKRLLQELAQIEMSDLPPPAKRSRFLKYEENSLDIQSNDKFEFYMQNADFSEFSDTEEKRIILEEKQRKITEVVPFGEEKFACSCFQCTKRYNF